MEEQDKDPIIPQREINTDQLEKKINFMPKYNEKRKNSQNNNKNKNGKIILKFGSVLDGAVSITGGPTIRSIKNMKNKEDFKFKMKFNLKKKPKKMKKFNNIKKSPYEIKSEKKMNVIPINKINYKPIQKNNSIHKNQSIKHNSR